MTLQKKITINADIGEGWPDAALAPYVDAVNIACGGHTGDEGSMRVALELAGKHGLLVGAHPSFPDRPGFGRTAMSMPRDAFLAAMTTQIAALATLANSLGLGLSHVKPHGALYHSLYTDGSLARDFVRLIPKSVAVVTMPDGVLAYACADAGIEVWLEGYADRGYTSLGRLAPRGLQGSLITDPDHAATQAIALICGQRFSTVDGDMIVFSGLDTICIHSDTPTAVNIAQSVSSAVKREVT